MTEATPREELLDAMAEVIERQARVARHEAALAESRRRLGDSLARLSRVTGIPDDKGELHPLVFAAQKLAEGLPVVAAAAGEERTGTLRERVVAAMEASPEEVYTPARLAPLVGSDNRDSIRNTLLVLAAKGRIAKLGAGQYQARRR